MDNYDEITRLAPIKQETEISNFLNKGITQFIQDNVISSSISFKVGSYIGREIVYSQLNYSTGKWYMQFTKFLFAKNNIYIIQCSIYTEGECDNEKKSFLNSISQN